MNQTLETICTSLGIKLLDGQREVIKAVKEGKTAIVKPVTRYKHIVVSKRRLPKK